MTTTLFRNKSMVALSVLVKELKCAKTLVWSFKIVQDSPFKAIGS